MKVAGTMEGTHKFIASAHSRKCASNASEPVGAPTVAVHPASDDILTAKAQRGDRFIICCTFSALYNSQKRVHKVNSYMDRRTFDQFG